MNETQREDFDPFSELPAIDIFRTYEQTKFPKHRGGLFLKVATHTRQLVRSRTFQEIFLLFLQ